jgi:hypothetical protein
MKKVIVCVCAYFIVALSFNKTVCADESGPLYSDARIETYISNLYRQIDFSTCNRLPYEVFDKAFRGYINLRNSGKLNADKEIISVCDFTLSSTENRLWIIDLAQKKVLFNTYVAHGQGSGEEYAQYFSNRSNSHQSSLGFYVTGDTYEGEHGTSLHLSGMDEGFNDAAYDRDIVVHGAEYVCNKFVSDNQRLGRSWGCPAVPSKLSLPIINTIRDGTCLFIYYPESKYLKTSYWLNKKVASLPGNSLYGDVAKPGAQTPATRVIEYISNGKTDSVKSISIAQ